MAAGKKKQKEMNPNPPPEERSLRDSAEEQLAHSPKPSPELNGKTSEQFIHELQVHQVELETQAEELRRAHLALEESRDKFLDLYDFAPTGYLTLTVKALIDEVNLAGATLLGVERSKLVNTRFRKFIAPEFFEQWDKYFVNLLKQEHKQTCTLTLKRSDGSTVPARMEGIRLTGSDGAITVRVAVSDITDIWQIEALKNEYSILNGILESTDSTVFSLDHEYRYTSFNSHHARVMKQIYGANIEPGHSIFDYQSVKEDQVQAKHNIDRALAGEHVTEEAFSGEEGRSRRYFEVTHYPVKDTGKKVIGVAVFAQDITDRRRADEAVRESEERYRRITEGLTDYLYTVHVNEGRAVSTVHGAACVVVTGYSSGEFAADPYLWIRMVFDEDRDRVITHVNAILNGKHLPPVEHRIVRKDGQIRWVRDTPILQLDDSGKLVSYDGVIKDITDNKQAEEALRESEDRLASAIEGSGVGLWDWYVQTKKTIFNERWAEIAGYTLAELSPVSIDTWINLCHPDDRQQSDELLKKHFSKQSPMYECEARIRHKDGHWVWVLDRGKVVERDSNDLPIRMTGTHLDITGRKMAEEALQEEQQFSKLILDSLPGIFYLYTYPEHQLTRWNKQHETLLGFTADEMKGKLASDWHLPELKDAVLKATNEVMERGQSSVESNLIAKDGNTIPFFLTGVRFEARGRLYYMGIGIDITERKRAEEAVRHLTEFQESIITNALVWLSVLDPSGKILVWNAAAAEISGYRADEILGNNEIWKKLYPEKEYRKQFTTTINRIIREKKSLENFETVIRTKEGYEKIISWNTKGIPDATGKRSDYIVIGMDVTDRHRAEEQLNKTVDELKKFNKLTVDRELRMIALKQEINALLKKAGEQEKYRNGS